MGWLLGTAGPLFLDGCLGGCAGAVVKKPLGAVDVRIVTNLLDDLQPDAIFAAGGELRLPFLP